MGGTESDGSEVGEFTVDEGVVRGLLRDQHPDLAELDLRRAVGGWDNQLWRLGEELAVRIPRTERAPDLLRKEYAWLPRLAPRLPLPVPTPVRAGEPSARFPWTWHVVTWVPGEPADRATITDADHAADTLASFLRALHTPAPPDAPGNPHRDGHLRTHTPGFEGWIGHEAVAPHVAGTVREIREVWEAAVAAPAWDGPRMWLHADLHPANVLVSAGTISGVIDFGDLYAGDPAGDLAAAWMLLPAGAAPRFLAAYGPPDEATVARARGWAARRALGLISIGMAGERGLPGGKPTWLPAGLRTLDRLLTEDRLPA